MHRSLYFPLLNGDCFQVGAFAAHACYSNSTGESQTLVLQHESVQVSGEKAARLGFVGIAATQRGALLPGIAAVEAQTGQDDLLWMQSNQRLAQKAALMTTEKLHELMMVPDIDLNAGTIDPPSPPRM